MKKFVLLIAVSLFLGGTAFGALITSTSTTSFNGEDFSPSNLVTIDLEVATNDYAAAAKHINGNKGFWTTDSNSVEEIASSCVKGTAITDLAVSAATDTTVASCQ